VREQETHQRIFALHIPIRKRLPILVHELEGPADLGPPDALRSLCHTLALHPRLLIAEVEDQARARDEEEETCFPGEGLFVACQFLTSFERRREGRTPERYRERCS